MKLLCLLAGSIAVLAPSALPTWQAKTPSTVGPRFQITDPGVPNGFQSVLPCAINNAGQIAATAHDGPSHNECAVFYSEGRFQEAGTLGGPDSMAYGLNNAGQMVGWSRIKNNEMRGFLWQDGKMTELGRFQPRDINDKGLIVGTSYGSLDGLIQAYVWENGTITRLPSLGGDISNGVSINNRGQAVGQSIQPKVEHTISSADHACLWDAGQVQDLGTLGDEGQYSEASAINDRGQVTGTSWVQGFAEQHAYLYSQGRMKDLGTLGGPGSFGRDLNNRGQVVGMSYVKTGNGAHAFLYTDGHLYDLNDLIPPGSDWLLLDAVGINDRGQIVGRATKQGQPRMFLLTPIPPPSKPVKKAARR